MLSKDTASEEYSQKEADLKQQLSETLEQLEESRKTSRHLEEDVSQHEEKIRLLNEEMGDLQRQAEERSSKLEEEL
ncbi:hypothetical protein ACOMHN_038827 [Nucella lapillus]